MVKSSAKLSQQINKIVTQNPLLPNAVKPLSASFNMHHFPITQLHLSTTINHTPKFNHKKQTTRTRFNVHHTQKSKSLHRARTDDQSLLSPPRGASQLSSHLHRFIHSHSHSPKTKEMETNHREKESEKEEGSYIGSVQ